MFDSRSRAARYLLVISVVLMVATLLTGPGAARAEAAAKGRPAIVGVAHPGNTLRADAGKHRAGKVSYAWYVNGRRVTGSTYKARYYVPTFDDLGKRITVRVTVTAKSGATKTYLSKAKKVKAPKRVRAACPTSMFTGFAAGADFAVALTKAGDVCTWGENGLGQLGTSTADYAATPQRVVLPAVKQIAAGAGHVLALTRKGEVYSWGSNEMGQLGIEDPATLKPRGDPEDGYRVNTPLSFVPRKVAGLPTIASIVASGQVSVAVAADGAAYVWGETLAPKKDGGAVITAITSPRKIAGISGVRKVVTDGSRFLALTTAGEVRQWGVWAEGQREVLPGVTQEVTRTYLSTRAIAPLPGQEASDIALSGYAAYIATTGGSVYAWGAGGAEGSMLPGLTSVFQARPAPIPGLTDIAAVYAGADSAVAITRGGHTLLWGAADVPVTGVVTSPAGDGLMTLVAPAVDPATLGFGGLWVGALTTSGRFTHLLTDDLNSYPGYPFRTAQHTPRQPSAPRLTVSDAGAAGCEFGYVPVVSSGIPVVVTRTVKLGKGRSATTSTDLVMPGTDQVTWGGAPGTCRGRLTVALTVRTTSAWTWKPDGRVWRKSAKKRFG